MGPSLRSRAWVARGDLSPTILPPFVNDMDSAAGARESMTRRTAAHKQAGGVGHATAGCSDNHGLQTGPLPSPVGAGADLIET